ncbi:MAG: hypothetical protein JXB49_23830 [Bacteroidales bacterium]|nr:hypothetical protein [Bacteroidales bacterium]
METTIIRENFDQYMEKKIKVSEELIAKTQKQLAIEFPKVWQIKRIHHYIKTMQEIRNNIDRLEWIASSFDLKHDSTLDK